MDAENRLDQVLREVARVARGQLDERSRRLVAGALALGLGRGGIHAAAELIDLDELTVARGARELGDDVSDLPEGELPRPEPVPQGRRRIRREGAGRKKASEHFPGMLDALQGMLNESGAGGESVLSWTTFSLRQISERLRAEHHVTAGKDVVARTLDGMGYHRGLSRRKPDTSEISDEELFRSLAAKAEDFVSTGDPILLLELGACGLCAADDASGLLRIGRWTGVDREADPEGILPGLAGRRGLIVQNGRTAWALFDENTEELLTPGTMIRFWGRHVGLPSFPDIARVMVVPDPYGRYSFYERLICTEFAELSYAGCIEFDTITLPPGTFRWGRMQHRLLFCRVRRAGSQVFLDQAGAVTYIGRAPCGTMGRK